jgi:phosphoserine phosphatase RsbU/P
MGEASHMAKSDYRLQTEIACGPDTVHSLACSEVWGGNNVVDLNVEVPGFMSWVHSRPLQPATLGGDVYYLAVCSKGLLSRIVLADVAGHGEAVSATAETLRNLLRKHMNALDQAVLMQEINEAFRRKDDPPDAVYATAAVLGYFCKTGELVFANAGHPAPLWYHARENTWDWLHEDTSYKQSRMEGVPLGLIPGTEYIQSAVQLGPADLLILYTDGISEATNEAGEELGYEGLLQLARSVPSQTTNTPGTMGRALLSEVSAFRGDSPAMDDQTLVVLQQTTTNMAAYASR